MTQPFLIGEAIRFGWHKTKAHSGVLFQAMMALFAVQIASSIVEKVLEGTLQGFLAMVVLTILSVIVSVGFAVITLKIARGHHATYHDLIPDRRLVWHYFLASILSCVLVLLGLILLIIPGIYLALRFSMVSLAVIDGAGPRESLTRSSKLTDGIKWKLLGFFLVIIALNILGMIALMVGLLVSMPVTAIAYAHVYDKLKSRA